jgi:hypothetical protein
VRAIALERGEIARESERGEIVRGEIARESERGEIEASLSLSERSENARDRVWV